MKRENELEREILKLLHGSGELSVREIAKKLKLGGKDVKKILIPALANLMRNGGTYMAKDKRYGARELFKGSIGSVHGQFAFAKKEDGQELFLSGLHLHGAMPGDKVLLRERSGHRRPSGKRDLARGEVVCILEKNARQLTGVFHRNASGAYLEPDGGFRGTLPVAGRSGAKDGDKVTAVLLRESDHPEDYRVRVTESFGSSSDPRACAEAILRMHAARVRFPSEVLKQADAASDRGVPEEELSGRLDLRGKLIFTIDGTESKDFDDAVSLEADEQGNWILGVHIADVSRYVLPGDPLDAEAYLRGTSIYYANQVIPMLPPALSNGICSLNPGEDRLAFSIFIRLTPGGQRLSYSLNPSVIRSEIRGVYGEINRIFDGAAEPELLEKYRPALETLERMNDLAKRLRALRMERGAIDLDTVESRFSFDGDGEISAVSPHAGGDAESLIEEFMLQANLAAADYAEKRELPFVYRIHESPPEDKIQSLFELLNRLGVTEAQPKGTVRQKVLSGILESVRGKELWPVVNSQILRSMAKACYREENAGHYGLMADCFCHFTSPIRRYPDLAIHRILHESLAGTSPDQLRKKYGAFVKDAAEQSSRTEIEAVSIERECEGCYKARYMKQHVGEVFHGVVSGAAPHALFVLLENSVEGMVSVRDLPEDSYDFDGTVTLIGRFSGKRWRVGNPVQVLVLQADVSSGKISFSLVEKAE